MGNSFSPDTTTTITTTNHHPPPTTATATVTPQFSYPSIDQQQSIRQQPAWRRGRIYVRAPVSNRADRRYRISDSLIEPRRLALAPDPACPALGTLGKLSAKGLAAQQAEAWGGGRGSLGPSAWWGVHANPPICRGTTEVPGSLGSAPAHPDPPPQSIPVIQFAAARLDADSHWQRLNESTTGVGYKRASGRRAAPVK